MSSSNKKTLENLLPVIIVITSYPSVISSNDPFEVEIQIKGAKKATNYLKLEIKDDKTNENVVETFNGTNWYNGADPRSYLPVNITSSTASAIIKGRLLQVSPTNGNYNLKIKRFTASGSLANDDQDQVSLKIQLETKSPSPSPIPKPEETPSPNPTSQSAQTATSPPKATRSPNVLAGETKTTPPKKGVVKKEDNFPILPAFIFALGLFLLLLPVMRFVTRKLNGYNGKSVNTKQDH